MARGFLSGAIWGTVLSVGGLGALSVVAPDRPVMPVETSEKAAAAVSPMQSGSASGEAGSEVQAEGTETSPSETTVLSEVDTGSDAPAESGAASDESAASAETDAERDPVAASDSTIEADIEADTSQAIVAGVRPEDVAPVTPDASTPVLDAPEIAQDTMPAETDAAPVPAPQTGDSIAALAVPEVGSPPVAPTVPAPQSTPGGTQAPVLSTPESDVGPDLSTEPAQPPAPPVPAAETPLAPASEDATAGKSAPETVAPDMAEPVAPTEDAPATDRPPVRRLLPSAPEAATSAEGAGTAALRPAIGTPAGSLTGRSEGNSSRLPSIGASDDSAPAQEAPVIGNETSLPPLQRFAAPVDSDPDLPKMSIIMIDDGTGPLGPDTLEGFPFPVTFALDPAQPGASDRMSAYRALGYEVATLVAVPPAAQPTDVEQILGGAIAALPESVALIEAPGGGLQADRAVTEQATSFVAESGHGLVFLPNGLNTAQAIAQREDVPALSILRDFDGEGQDARTKRRFLDGAAFRARQDGAVVMLGRLTPDTLSALVLWSLQDRASSVSMVPVSALLLDQSN
jgi:polysaccharide deacetylase 2 family uncharacterized protein YibQ